MSLLMTVSVLLWDIVEPAGLAIIAYLLYKIHKDLKRVQRLLEEIEIQQSEMN